MESRDSGRGIAKAIFTLAVIAAMSFVAFKTLPAYIHNYELQDYMRGLTVNLMAAGKLPTADTVRNNIVAKAQDMDLPVTSDNVKVSLDWGKAAVSADYTVPVNLVVYTLSLHFTPTAENKSLTAP